MKIKPKVCLFHCTSHIIDLTRVRNCPFQSTYSFFNLQFMYIYPPASEASREVENFDWRKNTPTRIWRQNFVCLSVCPKIWPQLSQDWQNRMAWNFFYNPFSQFLIPNLCVFKYLPRFKTFAGGYEICHTNFTST